MLGTARNNFSHLILLVIRTLAMRSARSTGSVLVVGLVVSALMALALGLAGCGGTSKESAGPRPPSRNATPVPAPSGPNEVVTVAGPADGQRPATSPTAAVTSFLDAEISGRFADSFAVLSTSDRDELGSVDQWSEQHASLPRVLSFSLVSAKGDGPVVTDVTYEPRVDEIAGVVAGAARVTWAAVPEGGGFVIDRLGSRVDSRYPDAELASAGVTRWIENIRSGDPTVGYDGTLLGQPSLVDRLATASGRFRTTTTTTLDRWGTPEVVTNAFGPDASTWARVVHVDGPVSFDAVTAPLGDQWVVVGVVET